MIINYNSMIILIISRKLIEIINLIKDLILIRRIFKYLYCKRNDLYNVCGRMLVPLIIAHLTYSRFHPNKQLGKDKNYEHSSTALISILISQSLKIRCRRSTSKFSSHCFAKSLHSHSKHCDKRAPTTMSQQTNYDKKPPGISRSVANRKIGTATEPTIKLNIEVE